MRRVLPLLLAGVCAAWAGEAAAGRLGIGIQNVTPELSESLGIPNQGILVRDVDPQGPAAAAGVQPGDVILELNRQPVSNFEEFVAATRQMPAGQSVALTIWRTDLGRYFIGVRLAPDEAAQPAPRGGPQQEERDRRTERRPPRGSEDRRGDGRRGESRRDGPTWRETPGGGPDESETPGSETARAEPRRDQPLPEAGEQHPGTAPADARNLVQNGGFEGGLRAPWGTGAISEGRPWRTFDGTRAFADVVPSPVRSGASSLRIRHLTDERSGWIGVTSQRLGLLEAGRSYTLSLWAAADGVEEGAVRLRVVRRGERPGVAKGLAESAEAVPVTEIALPQGSYDWLRREATFLAPEGELDLEILSVARGTAYIDDISVQRAP
jgi:hypothetical protein